MSRKAMTMAEWIRKLDELLRVSERDILTHAGKASNDAALKTAHLEYEKYRQALLNAPSAVERHFAEAISKTKRLAKEKKKGRS
ncbi:MAG: RhuM family protein [Burkholderiales bacterium]